MLGHGHGRSALGVSLVVALFAAMYLLGPLLELGLPLVLAGLAVLIVGLWAGVGYDRRRRDGDKRDSRWTVWDTIPSWQYTGRQWNRVA